ncbi:hypothetical protein HDU97_006529 [Phlyctochytrium planicorne]|nr:hypothetical protein HDU97_006529 [Phlyctochytrium planicorne]
MGSSATERTQLLPETPSSPSNSSSERNRYGGNPLAMFFSCCFCPTSPELEPRSPYVEFPPPIHSTATAERSTKNTNRNQGGTSRQQSEGTLRQSTTINTVTRRGSVADSESNSSDSTADPERDREAEFSIVLEARLKMMKEDFIDFLRKASIGRNPIVYVMKSSIIDSVDDMDTELSSLLIEKMKPIQKSFDDNVGHGKLAYASEIVLIKCEELRAMINAFKGQILPFRACAIIFFSFNVWDEPQAIEPDLKHPALPIIYQMLTSTPSRHSLLRTFSILVQSIEHAKRRGAEVGPYLSISDCVTDLAEKRMASVLYKVASFSARCSPEQTVELCRKAMQKFVEIVADW